MERFKKVLNLLVILQSINIRDDMPEWLKEEVE